MDKFFIPFNIPIRQYADSKKKMVAWRLPVALMKELENAATERGWNTTDVVVTALDQFVQWSKKNRKK